MQDQTIDVGLLKDLVPIKALSPDHCLELASKSKLLRIPSGAVIFRAGEAGNDILYLMSGKAELATEDGQKRLVVGGTKLAKLPLEQGSTHRCTATALGEAVLLSVDPNLLDIMLTWEQSGGYEVQEIGSDGNGDDDWMSRILQAKVFYRIPAANIQSVFMKMSSAHFKAGEVVISQGEEGDTFFIIRQGRCRVTRKTRRNPEGVTLADLSVGDNFGEDALISGGKRNASVTMLTDGVLMTLTKADFLELLNEPLLRSIRFAEAKDVQGVMWLDVRLPTEHQARHVRNSVNIPLPLLRDKLDKLDRAREYIVYCDTGRRSSTATYLLCQNGFSAAVLAQGLADVGEDDIVSQ